MVLWPWDRVPILDIETESICGVVNHCLIMDLEISDTLAKCKNIKNTQKNMLNSSGSFYPDDITSVIDNFFWCEDQAPSSYGDIWFCNKEACEIPKDTCDNILRAFIWLLANKKITITRNHLKYIGLKLTYQRLYELDTKQQLTPSYVYRTLDTIHYLMIVNYRATAQAI